MWSSDNTTCWKMWGNEHFCFTGGAMNCLATLEGNLPHLVAVGAARLQFHSQLSVTRRISPTQTRRHGQMFTYDGLYQWKQLSFTQQAHKQLKWDWFIEWNAVYLLKWMSPTCINMNFLTNLQKNVLICYLQETYIKQNTKRLKKEKWDRNSNRGSQQMKIKRK